LRNCPNVRVQKFRLPDPGTGEVYSLDINGQYIIPSKLNRFELMTVIASDGGGWDHVSVSLRKRTPTWEEMEYVRELFFRDDEVVMQLSVPARDHVNLHKFCLHMWRPQHVVIPRPPGFMVGPVINRPVERKESADAVDGQNHPE